MPTLRVPVADDGLESDPSSQGPCVFHGVRALSLRNEVLNPKTFQASSTKERLWAWPLPGQKSSHLKLVKVRRVQQKNVCLF